MKSIKKQRILQSNKPKLSIVSKEKRETGKN